MSGFLDNVLHNSNLNINHPQCKIYIEYWTVTCSAIVIGEGIFTHLCPSKSFFTVEYISICTRYSRPELLQQLGLASTNGISYNIITDFTVWQAIRASWSLEGAAGCPVQVSYHQVMELFDATYAH